MKYVVRSVKYFIYFSLLCSAIILALVAIGAVEGDINMIFKEGYTSVIKIAIFFAIVAAVYPKLGFITRNIKSDANWETIRQETIEYMSEKRYGIEKEDSSTCISFRVRGTAARLTKMYEDRITLIKKDGVWQMEGLRKDVLRLSFGLENRLVPHDEAQADRDTNN